MTKEQIEAIEQLYIEHSDRLDARSYSALELEEALEYVATNCIGLWRGESETVWAETGHGSYEGTTPLEAIQNARRGM